MAVSGEDEGYTIPSTCIEGIVVEGQSPGLRARRLIAVANATGRNAPRTNVARSSIEKTSEYEEMNQKIYRIYLNHVINEISRLCDEGHSLTWAVSNATSLVGPIFSNDKNNNSGAVYPDKLRESICEIPLFLTEKSSKRENVSFNEIKRIGPFWTVDSALIRSSEQLVKETSGNSSVSAVVTALDDPAVRLPDGVYLSNFGQSNLVTEMIEEEYEPVEINLQAQHRRIDLKWEIMEDTPRWVRIDDYTKKALNMSAGRLQGFVNYLESLDRESRRGSPSEVRRLWIPVKSVASVGLAEYGAFKFSYRTFLCPQTPIAKFFEGLTSNLVEERDLTAFLALAAVFFASLGRDAADHEPKVIDRLLNRVRYELGDVISDTSAFLDAIAMSPSRIFDSSAWSRRGLSNWTP